MGGNLIYIYIYMSYKRLWKGMGFRGPLQAPPERRGMKQVSTKMGGGGGGKMDPIYCTFIGTPMEKAQVAARATQHRHDPLKHTSTPFQKLLQQVHPNRLTSPCPGCGRWTQLQSCRAPSRRGIALRKIDGESASSCMAAPTIFTILITITMN